MIERLEITRYMPDGSKRMTSVDMPLADALKADWTAIISWLQTPEENGSKPDPTPEQPMDEPV